MKINILKEIEIFTALHYEYCNTEYTEEITDYVNKYENFYKRARYWKKKKKKRK